LREAKMQQLILPESETEVARTTALSKEALDSVVAVTHVSDPTGPHSVRLHPQGGRQRW